MTSPAWAAVEPTIDVSYQPAAPTRITIVGRDGSLVNVVQDFVPSALPALPTETVAEVVPTRPAAPAMRKTSQTARSC